MMKTVLTFDARNNMNISSFFQIKLPNKLSLVIIVVIMFVIFLQKHLSGCTNKLDNGV